MRWVAALLCAACGLLVQGCVGEADAGEPVPLSPLVARVEAADGIAGAWEPPRWRSRVHAGLAPGERALAGRLRAPGGALENPCLIRAGQSCARTALDPFFVALDGLARVEARRPVVITALGNSLIASDRIVDRVRRRFAGLFGDGGRGALLVDRLAPYGPRTRTGRASGGWVPRTLGELSPSPHPFGLLGVYHQATRRDARSRFSLHGEHTATLWWLDGRSRAPFSLWVDGRRMARTSPRGSGEGMATRIALPPRARSFEVRAEAPGAVALGVVLEKTSFGVVLDTAGVPSADATLWLRADETLFRSQLRQRDPRLVMLLLGGNEAKRLEWHRTKPDRVEAGLRALLRRAREAVPEAACLVVGPIDAVRGPDHPKPWTERPWLQRVNALEREVALGEGCAFFDLYAAMGGHGSLRRFHALGLVHDDLVHPRGRGLDLLGDLLAEALLRAFTGASTPQDPQALQRAWAQLRAASPPVQAERSRAAAESKPDPLSEIDPLQLAPEEDTQAAALRSAGLDLKSPGLRGLLEERGWLDGSGALTAHGWLALAALRAAGTGEEAR